MLKLHTVAAIAALAFALTNARAGSIEGKLTANATGQPIASGAVRIHGSGGSYLGSAYPNASGNYTYSGLAAGTYFARTDGTGFFDELWNDKPCAQGVCTITTGTPISVGAGATTANFALDSGGSITGKITASATGQPIASGAVRIHGSSGSYLGSAYPNASGNYTYSGLAAGTYFARTDSTGFSDELWDNKPCAQGACTITTGTPISVGAGATTANFTLDSGGSIAGKITASATGQPIASGAVRIHGASGTYLGSAYPNASGNYTYGGLAAGTYFARTDGTGFIDELWDNKPCAQGACTITAGTPIVVSTSGTIIANFQLAGAVDLVFRSGFETPMPTQTSGTGNDRAAMPGAWPIDAGCARLLQQAQQAADAPDCRHDPE